MSLLSASEMETDEADVDNADEEGLRLLRPVREDRIAGGVKGTTKSFTGGGGVGGVGGVFVVGFVAFTAAAVFPECFGFEEFNLFAAILRTKAVAGGGAAVTSLQRGGGGGRE